MKKNVFLTVLMCCLMCSCADGFDQNVVNTALKCADPGGFFWGFWNGWTAPFSFVASLFTDNISCYDACNTGGWYWFGYLWGTGSIGFGLKATVKRSR